MTGELRVRVLGTFEVMLENRPISALQLQQKSWAACLSDADPSRPSATCACGALLGGTAGRESTNQPAKISCQFEKLFGKRLIITRQSVAFDTGTAYWIDAEQFAADGTTQAAIDLYSGDFLAGLHVGDAPAFEQWVVRQRVQLRQQMLTALQGQIDAAIEWGAFAVAAGHCQRLLTLEPWREETHRTLMLLLARLGERSAAFRQYKVCGEVMQAEFGVEPMAVTADLMRRIRYAPQPNHNLPVQSAPCIGRKTELTHLQTLLRDKQVRLVSLVGVGGMGKTRLAAAVGEAIRPNFLEGVWFVDASPVETIDLLPSTIAHTLGLKPNPSKPILPQLQTFLKERELLLIIDNFEQLIAGRELLLRLLDGASQVKLLVTSRERLRLRAERVVVVEGFAEMASAVELFGRTVHRQHPTFDRIANQQQVKTICELVQRSPLAIKLAAASAAHLPCDHIIRAVQENLDVLQTAMPDVAERHRSVRAVFEHSWALLSAELQTAFARLSIFRGSFTLAAAREICSIPPALLTQLVAKSLLRRIGDRYTTHELLRQYARRRLTDAEQLQSAHAVWYIERLSRQFAPLNSDASLAVQQNIQTEYSNIAQAWSYAVENLTTTELQAALPTWFLFHELTGDLEQLHASLHRLHLVLRNRVATDSAEFNLTIRAATQYARALVYRGAYEDATAVAQEAVSRTEAINDPQIKAIALSSLIGALFNRGSYDEMDSVLSQLEALPLPDSREKADALYRRGTLAGMNPENADEAIALLEGALAVIRRVGLWVEESRILLSLGIQYFNLQDRDAEAERYFETAIAIARKQGSWRSITTGAIWLMNMDFRLNRMAKARERLEEVIEIYQRTGNRLDLGQPYMNLGLVYLSQEQFVPARENLDLGLSLYREQEHRFGAMMCLTYLGRVDLYEGKLEDAGKTFANALQLATELDFTGWILPIVVFQIERCVKAAGTQLIEAEGLIASYEERVATSQNPRVEMWFATARAGVALRRGDLEAAFAFAERGVSLSESMVMRYQPDALARLGEVQMARGEWGSAEKTWQTVLALRTELQQPISAALARQHLASIKQHLHCV